MLTFHPSPLSATKPPHCTSSPFCSPGAIRPPLWPSTRPVGSHSNTSVTPQRHSPNGRALCHRHLVLGAQHCLPCTCQSETGAARHPQWGGTRSASSWAQGQTHQENTCSAQANVSPSKGLLFVLHIQLAGRRLAQRGRAGIRLQTTGGCHGGAAAQGSARLCSTCTVQDRGGSTQTSPAGIKKDCALKQSVRRRSLVADIFPVSLNVESLCFPYEIFNNLRMLSALRAVLH